ncbi:hypothetical protein [aff. Roholtiella sp. LEGE 12411]|uniref:hypothetical protein n=1 Tax=aff. Roholtiella sp. LEGE 12411 TaxID=1828822 RepID=UPI0018810B57|nr:hypothetical protein [aff. Roholtiella sp. LEGE 12411]MBE9037651.1 hypothetical protein [aff. Roholtiella sp. LEGE 12411]
MQLLKVDIPRKPKGDIAITKFKIKGDWEEVQITFELPPETTERKVVQFVCKERPRNELIKAFDGLMENVSAIAGLNWEAGVITVIGFQKGDEGMLVNIIAQDDGDYKVTANISPFYPTGEFLKKIENLIAEVEDYIGGKRAQTSLFDSQP